MEDEQIDIKIDHGPDAEYLNMVVEGVTRGELEALRRRLDELERRHSVKPAETNQPNDEDETEEQAQNLPDEDVLTAGPSGFGGAQPSSESEPIASQKDSQKNESSEASKACVVCERVNCIQYVKSYGPILCKNCYEFTKITIRDKRMFTCELDGNCSLKNSLGRLCRGCRWSAIVGHPDFKHERLAGFNDLDSETSSDSESISGTDPDSVATTGMRSNSESSLSSYSSLSFDHDEEKRKTKNATSPQRVSNQSDSQDSGCEICGHKNLMRKIHDYKLCKLCFHFTVRTIKHSKIQLVCRDVGHCLIEQDGTRKGPCRLCRWNKIRNHPNFRESDFIDHPTNKNLCRVQVNHKSAPREKSYSTDSCGALPTSDCEICSRPRTAGERESGMGFNCCNACYLFVRNVLVKNYPLVCPQGGGCVIERDNESPKRFWFCRACRWNKIITHPKFKLASFAKRYPLALPKLTANMGPTYSSGAFAGMKPETQQQADRSIQPEVLNGTETESDLSQSTETEKNHLDRPQEGPDKRLKEVEVQTEFTQDRSSVDERSLSSRNKPFVEPASDKSHEDRQPQSCPTPTYDEYLNQSSRWIYEDFKHFEVGSKRKRFEEDIAPPIKRIAIVQCDDINGEYNYLTTEIKNLPIKPYEEITTVELEVRPSVSLLKARLAPSQMSQQDTQHTGKRSYPLLSFIMHYRRTIIDRRPMIKLMEARNRQTEKEKNESEEVTVSLISPDEDCDGGGDDSDIIEIDCDT